MKDKLSKFKSLIKKYGFVQTIKKIISYILSKIINIFNSMNFIRNRNVSTKLDKILEKNNYDRIIIWRSNFGWNVPLFQRPQHISLGLSKQKCLVFYEVTHFTDKIKDLEEINKIYNPKAFINCSDFKNMDELKEKIIELDNDDKKYMEYLKEPVFNKEFDYRRERKKFEDFLNNIISKDYTEAKKVKMSKEYYTYNFYRPYLRLDYIRGKIIKVKGKIKKILKR